jgi:zinc transport system substrate-binding protein
MNKRLFVIIIVIMIGFFGLYSGGIRKSTNQNGPKKLQVSASFYPMYYFAKEIGGDKADVYDITPAGGEPHDYEPTTGDIARIETGSLLILNGGGLESWGDKIKTDLEGKPTNIVTATDGLKLQQSAENGNSTADPHVWLDPQLAKKEVDVIAGGFEVKDAVNAGYYRNNAAVLESKLNTLNNNFRQGLADCKQKVIITSHAAFGYIAAEYGLKQLAISGLSPDMEPSPTKMAEISDFAKTNHIKYIFFESLVSPKLAETIAAEAGAKTIVFNPLEGLSNAELAGGKDYFSIQKQNLENLRIALECK